MPWNQAQFDWIVQNVDPTMVEQAVAQAGGAMDMTGSTNVPGGAPAQGMDFNSVFGDAPAAPINTQALMGGAAGMTKPGAAAPQAPAAAPRRAPAMGVPPPGLPGFPGSSAPHGGIGKVPSLRDLLGGR